MSVIRKCDRCGKVFDAVDTEDVAMRKRIQYQVYKMERAFTLRERYEFLLTNVDLCADCQKSLQRWWLQEGKKDV